jgi:hypothetical protein
MTDLVLVVTHPSEPTQNLPLEGWLITIGSMAGNDLLLPGEEVAAKHAMLERKGDEWFVRDMDSRGGTILDDHRLLPGVPEKWSPGQEIIIADYRLSLSDQPIVAPPPPPTPTTIVQPIAALRLKLNPVSVMARLDAPVEMTLDIENQTNAPLELTLRLSGIPPGWLTLQPGPLHLAPHQLLKLSTMLQIPRDASATAGRHTFEIIAESADKSGRTAGEIVIPPFSQPVISITPTPMRHGQTATITVHNVGNVPAIFDLQGVDVRRELVFELPETQLSLAPGENGTASITARATKRPWALNERTVPIELQAQTEATKITRTTQVVVPPRIPTAALLLLGLPLLAVLFFAGRGVLCRQEITRLTNTRYDRLCGLLPDVTPTPEPLPTITSVPSADQTTTGLPDENQVLPLAATATVTVQLEEICEGAPPTQLSIGDSAVVSNLANVNLLVRQDPLGGSGAENVVCELREGRLVEILDGPVCDGDGHRMYRIRSRDNDVICEAGGQGQVAEGWSIEGNIEDGVSFYYLVPIE